MDFWCTFAKFATWIPFVLSLVLLVASLIPGNPYSGLIFSAVISALIYLGLLWVLYNYPQFCTVIGVISFVLFIANVILALSHTRTLPSPFL